MKISRVEIKNFRAFKGVPFEIVFGQKQRNLLVYGENGSGKSSLFLAVKNFLECESKRHDINAVPFRNVFVPNRLRGKRRKKNEGFVKLTFESDRPDPEARLYEWSEQRNETAERLILETDKTKGFIDYKALLATYFLHQEKGTVNIFDLLVNHLLANTVNDYTKRGFGDEWRRIQTSIPIRNTKWQLERLENLVSEFNTGLASKLRELHAETQTILRFFGHDLEVDFEFRGVRYNRAGPREQKGFENNVELKVKFFDEEHANHHHFLNEAKLSAIAVSIFFAALRLQPSARLKILALDDVLLGLDMSNRLPILDVLEKHFADFQIFFFTYDRAWYEIVKQRVDGNKWKRVEFFASKTDEHDLPIYAEDKSYLEKAERYFRENDYKAAAVYLRTHFEVVLKKFCMERKLKIRYTEDPTTLTSQEFWDAVKSERSGQPKGKRWVFFTDRLVQQVELCRSVTLNPLSHSTMTATFKKEIEDSIKVVRWLEAVLRRYGRRSRRKKP